MARNWHNLSDYEFEQLVGDVLGVDLAMRFERFTRGKDGGIDLRQLPVLSVLSRCDAVSVDLKRGVVVSPDLRHAAWCLI